MTAISMRFEREVFFSSSFGGGGGNGEERGGGGGGGRGGGAILLLERTLEVCGDSLISYTPISSPLTSFFFVIYSVLLIFSL